MPGATTHSSFDKELSGLAFFISIPQLIASPLIVAIAHLVMPSNIVFEAREVLDFFVISFPLTVSIAIIMVFILKGKFNLFILVFSVAAAALLSNLLHAVVGKAPQVDISDSLSQTFTMNSGSGGNYLAVKWVLKMFGIYWHQFGPVIFIQSCCIGIYAALRYTKAEEKRSKQNREI